MRFKKVLPGLFIIILFISLVINYNYLQELEIEKSNYQVFIDQIYSEINHVLISLEEITSEDFDEDSIEESLDELTIYLVRLDHSLQKSSIFINGVNSKGINLAELIEETINQGQVYNNLKIHAFAEDHSLNNQEVRFLLSIRDYILETKNLLTSEDTGQENSQISKSSLNNILSRFDSTNYSKMINSYSSP
jgi:hypothetical protein